jgi:cytochrome oxidase assembly protein ShyY1
LGFWQLRRAGEKEALLAQYRAAQNMPPISFPTSPIHSDRLPLFRYSTGVCLRPMSKRSTAGQNRHGEPGYVMIVECSTGAEGPGMSVEVGWSKNPNVAVNWRGGPVSGIIAPDRKTRMRLVAATSPQGLEPSAPPSIDQIPNNHRSYAVQWFLFALIAAVIYVLALRKKQKDEANRP